MPIQPARALHVLTALRLVAVNVEQLDRAIADALADLPSPPEYRLLHQIARTTAVMCAALRDLLDETAKLWP